MKVTIESSPIQGRVKAPPSKSLTHRSLVCAALAEGSSVIIDPLISDDTKATADALKKLGIEISCMQGKLTVHGGRLESPIDDLHCGESGTTLRFMTAICSLVDGSCRLFGGPSLSRRPIGPLLEALHQLGVGAECVNGTPPVTVKGTGVVNRGRASIRGDVSSQFVSALLLISPLTEGLTIDVSTPLESKPYVRMTMKMMEKFCVHVESSDDFRRFRVEGQKYRPTELKIDGDWSSSSNMLAAGAIGGFIGVSNLDLSSSQGDKAILDILEKMGAYVEDRDGVIYARRSKLRSIDYDVSDSPDLFPILTVLCSIAEGKSTIRGITRLRMKESDRIKAMKRGLREMGINAYDEGDSFQVEGGIPRGCEIDPYGDHRIAMAFAVLGLAADGDTCIRDAECVTKSYPNFWRELESLGIRLRR